MYALIVISCVDINCVATAVIATFFVRQLWLAHFLIFGGLRMRWAEYCVYCYNGVNRTYYRKSKDFILTKKYHKCEICGRRRRLVVMSLFYHMQPSDYLIYDPRLASALECFSIIYFYIPLNIVVWTYRFFKKYILKKDIQ